MKAVIGGSKDFAAIEHLHNRFYVIGDQLGKFRERALYEGVSIAVEKRFSV